METVREIVFIEGLVKCGNSHTKQNTCDILKAVHPFFPFRTLATHINYGKFFSLYKEGGFYDTRSLDTGTEDILFRWDKTIHKDTVNIFQVIIARIV